jgi:hypothetical protein
MKQPVVLPVVRYFSIGKNTDVRNSLHLSISRLGELSIWLQGADAPPTLFCHSLSDRLGNHLSHNRQAYSTCSIDNPCQTNTTHQLSHRFPCRGESCLHDLPINVQEEW